MKEGFISEESYIALEAYLGNKMDDAERLAFEALLAADPSLRSAYEDLRALLAQLQQHEVEAAMRSRMAAWDSASPLPIDSSSHSNSNSHSDSHSAAVPQQGSLRKFLQRAALAAAAIALLLLAYQLMQPRKGKQLYQEYFAPDPRVPYAMGAASDNPNRQAFAAYQAEEYAAAVPKFEFARSLSPANDTLRYFQGIALLAVGEHDAAFAALTPLRNNKSSPFSQMAGWYMALITLKTCTNMEAAMAMDPIRSDSTHPMQQQADEIMRALGK